MKLQWPFFGYNSPAIYIDLGTANTVVAEKDRGFIANEPSVIAYRESADGKRRIVAVGNEAKKKIGRTPVGLRASRPLKEGVVAELDATEAMLKYFLSFRKKSLRQLRPKLVISLPYGVSDIEKMAARDCCLAAGAREVVFIEEPMAAAIGSNLPIESPRGSMIIDIGGGTTEVAVISLYGIVHCETVRVGGHLFDEAIVNFIRRRHGLMVGTQSAERLKMEIGSALPGGHEIRSKIRGVDLVSGLPREAMITAHEISEAIAHLLVVIVGAGKRTLENTPPELLTDVVEKGAVIAGGGALLGGLAEHLTAELGIPVRQAPEPLLAIAKGGATTLADEQLLARISLE